MSDFAFLGSMPQIIIISGGQSIQQFYIRSARIRKFILFAAAESNLAPGDLFAGLE